jgi:NADP-reducing hydrogenase subunit HndC
MSDLSLEKLNQSFAKPQPITPSIRVSMDTGSIAAGAREVYKALLKKRHDLDLEFPIFQTGSAGLAFADPVVTVSCGNSPPISYGAMDAESAERILTDHCQRGRLVDDHVMGIRNRSKEIGQAQQFAVLIKDTSVEKEDRTAFFQSVFDQELAVHNLSDSVHSYRAYDLGLHNLGICVQLLPSGVTYTNVLSTDVRRIIAESILKNEVIEDLLYSEPDPQHRFVLRNCGEIDPESIEDYLRVGGYRGFGRLLKEDDPEKAISELKDSGLRGRGGAGFPTWLKWKLTRAPEAERKFVICNADEGDPGAFMDRSVLESDPHAVLEGLMCAAFCIGANKGFLYIRAEYPLAVERVELAIRQARELGLLGENILGSGFSFDAEVRLGAGAFVCGEETALIASIEGKRGSPEPRPPYPSVSGLWGHPTSINNVETLAAVSAIYSLGADTYAAHGTDQSKGTKVFAVTGKVLQSQLVEIPMGLSIRAVIENICGGALDHMPIKAVQTGGPSGGVIPEQLLDTPISYESLKELGSIMGSGGMLVMDVNDSMVDVAKFYLKFCVDESCGKCAPCRVGGFQMLGILDRIFRGRGLPEDIAKLHRIAESMQKASLCGLGQTAPNPVLSTLKYYDDEYRAFIEGGTAYARKMKKQLAAGNA